MKNDPRGELNLGPSSSVTAMRLDVKNSLALPIYQVVNERSRLGRNHPLHAAPGGLGRYHRSEAQVRLLKAAPITRTALLITSRVSWGA